LNKAVRKVKLLRKGKKSYRRKNMYTLKDKQMTFYDEPVYSRTVPQDHFLRKLTAAVDFNFVNDLCKDLYSPDNGRPCWEPAMMFRVIFLQFLYDLSDREIEEEISDRMSFKWFLGLSVDENVPDFSALSRFRDRLGAERFAQIFNKIVETARTHRLVSNKLHIVDSTDVKAKVDQFRITDEIKKEEKQTDKKDNGDNDKQSIGKYQTPDSDARFGRKSDTRKFYGYKEHVRIDAESEIIVDCKTTPGNESDCHHFHDIIDPHSPPGVITADKGYDTQENHKFLEEMGTRNGIILKNNHGKSYSYPKRVSKVARKYRSFIEHKFAELKNYHSLKVARYWGLSKMTIQAYITATVVNCKRIIKLLYSAAGPPRIMLRTA
jgi:IS5 family transposase